jgi:hypothetical protein
MPTEPTVLTQLAHRFGRRGLKLIVYGIGFTAFGLDVALGPYRERFSRPGPSPLDWADHPAWGSLFIIGGLFALVIGCQRRRAPDALGFGALQLAASVWACLYGISWVTHATTGGDYGEPHTWVGMIVWGILALSIRIDAGWADVDDPILEQRRTTV